LDKGARNVEILKQPQYSPFPVEKQVAIIYLGTQGLIRDVPVNKVKDFEENFLLEMENRMPELMAEFKKGNLPEQGLKDMVKLANEMMPQYKAK
jgi:F-type H+-transporting ATPase subunit alpha